jgi:hypothetical protein
MNESGTPRLVRINGAVIDKLVSLAKLDEWSFILSWDNTIANADVQRVFESPYETTKVITRQATP